MTIPALRQRYEELLAEHGLDKIPIGEQQGRESFEAMFDAGWLGNVTTKHDAWADYWGKESNRFVARGYEQLVQRLAAGVENDIRIRGGKLPCTVLVGTWPIGFANACALPTSGGVLVLLSHGLISLLYHVAKVSILSHDWMRVAAPGADPNRSISENLGWESYGWTREKTIDALVAIFRSYFRDGSVTTAPRQPLPKQNSLRQAQLAATVHFAERFLVSHEYAHVLCEHCGPLVLQETASGDLKDVFLRSRQQEFDADELATSLVFAECDLRGGNYDSEIDGNTRVAGIMLLFACNLLHDVVHEGVEGFAVEAPTYETHPPAAARAGRILRYVERFGSEFTNMGRIQMSWALDVACDVAEKFHDEREKSGERYPYLRRRFSTI